MASISHMVDKCRGRKAVFLCLNDRTTVLDEVEVLPGLNAKVLIQGHPKGNEKNYIPTVVELKCQDLDKYLIRRQWKGGG